MTFQDLPDEWPSMSLSDPDLALDVVDLFLGYRDRLKNSALLILCDESGRAIQPLVVNHIDWNMPAAERVRLFRLVKDLEIPQVVVAVSSPAGVPTILALGWRETAATELAHLGVVLLGFYSADTDEVWQPEPLAA